MAKTIIFHNSVRLFGENLYSGEKVLHRMNKFDGQTPIQVETLFQCPSNLSFDFIHDGYKYSEVSPNLLEIIS